MRINAKPNGPYIITGCKELVDPSGKTHVIPDGKIIALCRCGQSKTKPFCDATHNACGFKSTETAQPPK